jgi:nucleotide-binding universal stress UspA family protein
MLSHVLVPLDGSPLAEDALKHALEIVSRQGKITLVCAVEPQDTLIYGYYPAITAPDYQSIKNEMMPYAKHYLEGVAKDLITDGYTVRQEVKVGDAATVITDMAEKLHVDAIVMSTHGRSGISRFLFGSVTNKVLEAKVCPVFVVPSKNTVKVEKPVTAAEPIN